MSSTGLRENSAGLLCYILGWVTGLIFLALERDSKFVKFHAMQSLVVFLFLSAVAVLVPVIPIIGWFVSILAWPVGFVVWILMMYKAYKGEMYKLPVAGDFAERYVNK
ncbi:MAG: DUF4870 domain-containing protein [Candidatus Eiseniibacteriota bacterium]|nr:MAG: DUF4870 domain-containing protein [Candidatus Eisenbacteria bacterium]